MNELSDTDLDAIRWRTAYAYNEVPMTPAERDALVAEVREARDARVRIDALMVGLEALVDRCAKRATDADDQRKKLSAHAFDAPRQESLRAVSRQSMMFVDELRALLAEHATPRDVAFVEALNPDVAIPVASPEEGLYVYQERQRLATAPVVSPSTLDNKLDDLLERCGHDNWDRDGAHAITVEAVAATKRFLDTLHLSPLNTGGIACYWLDEAVEIDFDAAGRLSGVYVEVNDANERLGVLSSDTPEEP